MLAIRVSPLSSVPTLPPMPQTQDSHFLISGEEAHARVPRLSLCLYGTVLAWKYPTKNRSAVGKSYGTEESNLVRVTVWLA